MLYFINVLCYNKSTKNAAVDIGLKSISFKRVKTGLSLSLTILLMYPLLAYILDTTIDLNEKWGLNAIGLLLTAGVTEELLFRGFLFGKLRVTMSFRKAAGISVMAFSLAHLLMFTYMDWTIALSSTLLAVGLSIPFAYLYETAENSIWSPAIFHAAIRSIGMIFITEDKNYIMLVLAWMAISLLVPNIFMLLNKKFRKLWNSELVRIYNLH